MKALRVTMPDGSKWDVPAAAIAHKRAEHYAKLDSERDGDDFNATYMRELEFTAANPSELIDYAENNVNWSDVAHQAVPVKLPSSVDWQEGWVNGPKEIVEVDHE